MGGALREAPLLPQLHDDGAEQQHRRAGQGGGQEQKPVLPGFEHLHGGEVPPGAFRRGRGVFGVFQQGAARRAHRQHQAAQHPKADPDAPPPAQKAYQEGERRTGEPHRPADDAGGEALFLGVPLLGAAHHRRIEEGTAQPHRQREGQIEQARPPRRHEAHGKKARRQQRRARKARDAGARFVLQKAPQHAPEAEGPDGEAEHKAGRPLVKAVFRPHRPLEHAPSGGHPGQYLDGGPRRQDGPAVFFQKALHRSFPLAVFGLVWPHPVDKCGRGRL